MTTMTQTQVQVYQLFIKATPEQIWEAITKPEFTAKYFYGSLSRVDARARLAVQRLVARPHAALGGRRDRGGGGADEALAYVARALRRGDRGGGVRAA